MVRVVDSVERRFTSGVVEVRAADSERRTIGGYAAKFHKRSRDLGGFVEQIDSRFFNKSRGDGWPGVLARYNHDDNMLLGTSDAGTLRLSVDSVGLAYEVDVPRHREDVYELVSRGDVRKSSFAFVAYEDDWSETEEGYPLRTLISGRLIDVAPVNTPAYPDTSTGLRSLAERVGADFEEIRRLAKARELHKVLKRPVTVIDLGSAVNARSEDSAVSESPEDGQSETHPPRGTESVALLSAWYRRMPVLPEAQG